MKRVSLWVLLAAVGAGLAFVPLSAQEPEKKKEGGPAVARARKTVQMLDDIYKTAIVIVTDKYVNEDSDTAAGDAFQALFAAVEKKGWHKVRLLDATGEPYDEDNKPREGFEQRAVQALVKGESWYEETANVEGKRVLMAATPIPVVMKKCTMCHAHYANVPEGKAIGALSYTIPIE